MLQFKTDLIKRIVSGCADPKLFTQVLRLDVGEGFSMPRSKWIIIRTIIRSRRKFKDPPGYAYRQFCAGVEHIYGGEQCAVYKDNVIVTRWH